MDNSPSKKNDINVYIDEDITNSSCKDMIDNLEDFDLINNSLDISKLEQKSQVNDAKETKRNAFKKIGNCEVFESFNPDNLLKPVDVEWVTECFIESRILLKEFLIEENIIDVFFFLNNFVVK
jgi:hypothetical protein